MIANIIPEAKSFGGQNFFSYLVPTDLSPIIQVGDLVVIPFGKKKIRGIVHSFGEELPANDYVLKEILSIEPNFRLSGNYLAIAQFVADYYLCSPGEAISLFLPPEMKRPRQPAKTEAPTQLQSVINLTPEQEEIFQELTKKLASPDKPALLHGITGSGKTEIYLKLTKEALSLGKQVVILVPEIILTPQTVERFTRYFGDQIVLMHSGLSKTEKYLCYQSFYEGKKPIIIGPRSALLIPSTNIGLIIIDEEHEDSYKQEQNPRYHAVTLAKKIASVNNCLLLLGSATPQIETFHLAQKGEYSLFTLNKRYHKSQLPKAKIVDLRMELKSGNISPISLKLQEEVEEALGNRKQILLFLNRRGTATFVSCRDCGHVITCPNCAIPLVYHLDGAKQSLDCHHCGHQEKNPQSCPACKSAKIRFFGAGIEKIETEVNKMFPEARCAKIDATTITSKHDYQLFYRKIKNHELDIIIGTQMIAKGLDIPGIDLVGIVSADTGLHLPHYRAAERSFQLLTQVSGRSGRRDHPGKTIIQTYWPEAPSITFACNHDYTGFYREEIESREKFRYPPYTRLVRILGEGPTEEKAKEKLLDLAEDLRQAGLDFVGPGPCFYRKLHSKYRFQLIVKTDMLPSDKITKVFKNNPQATWDIDPVNLL